MPETEWVQEGYHLSIGEFTLIDNRNPEVFLLEKEKINALSREAKIVLSLIFLEAVREVKNTTLREVDFILRVMGWNSLLITKTKAEIRRFLNEY